MKKKLFLILSLFVLVLSGCDNEKISANHSISENYIAIEGKDNIDDFKATFILGNELPGMGYAHSLVMYGGTEYDKLLTMPTYFENDVVMLGFIVITSEKEFIPAGTYSICFNGVDVPSIKSNSIYLATCDYIPAYAIVASEGETNMIYGGELIVTKEEDVYTFTLESVLDNGKNIKLYYKGELTIDDYESPFSAPMLD